MPGDYGLMGYMQNINTAHRRRFTVQMAVQCTLCTEPPCCALPLITAQLPDKKNLTKVKGRL